MILECKIDAIVENEIQKERIPVIITLIKAKHQDYNFEFENKFDTYPIVLLKDSWIAKDIMHNPEHILNLDLRNFEIRRIEFDDIQQKFGYFHSDLISNISEQQASILNFEKRIADSLTECIFSCHSEMYLYFVLKVIWVREFDHNTDYERIKQPLFSRYFDVIAVIYMEKFKLRLPDHDSILQNSINEIKNKYSDVIEYSDEILDAIHRYIPSNEEASFVSLKMLHDEKYYYKDYIQRLMVESYKIIAKRISKHTNSKNYFAHEFRISNKRVELKIFPTPFGFTQVEEIISLGNQNKLDDLLIEHLSQNKIQYIGNDSLRELLNTKWVFKHKEIISPFYVDRAYKISKSKFNRQKRNNLFGSMMGQGQINLSTAFLEPHCA